MLSDVVWCQDFQFQRNDLNETKVGPLDRREQPECFSQQPTVKVTVTKCWRPQSGGAGPTLGSWTWRQSDRLMVKISSAGVVEWLVAVSNVSNVSTPVSITRPPPGELRTSSDPRGRLTSFALSHSLTVSQSHSLTKSAGKNINNCRPLPGWKCQNPKSQ